MDGAFKSAWAYIKKRTGEAGDPCGNPESYGCGGSEQLSKQNDIVRFCVNDITYLVRYRGIWRVSIMRVRRVGSVLLNAPRISFASNDGLSGRGLPGHTLTESASEAECVIANSASIADRFAMAPNCVLLSAPT